MRKPQYHFDTKKKARPYPIMMPMCSVMKKRAIQRVCLDGGEHSSIHTGKYTLKIDYMVKEYISNYAFIIKMVG